MLVFDWIAGSSQVKLFKTELVVRKSINSIPGLKVNQIITVSPIEFFGSFSFVYLFCDY